MAPEGWKPAASHEGACEASLQPASVRVARGLGSVLRARLRQDVGDVMCHGVQADVELGGDLLVGMALCH